MVIKERRVSPWEKMSELLDQKNVHGQNAETRREKDKDEDKEKLVMLSIFLLLSAKVHSQNFEVK